MRNYFGLCLLVVFVVSMLVGIATAGIDHVPIYCDCDCIDGKMYKCCNEFDKGQWYIVCTPGCRPMHWGCTPVPK